MSRNAKLGLFSIVLLIASGVVISQPSIWQSDDTYLTAAICGGAVAVLLLVLVLIIFIIKILFRKTVKIRKSNPATVSVSSATIIHDQSSAASKKSLTKNIITRKLTWALTAILISLIGTIVLFLTTDLDFIEPKTISLSQVQGISNDFWESLGELYDVSDNVIVEFGTKYSFLVNMKNPEIFGVDTLVVTGTSNDLNLMSREAAFVYDYSISSYRTKAKTFGSGMYDSGTVTSSHPNECIFWLATAGSIPGSDDMRLVRAFKKAEMSDESIPWDFSRSIRSSLRSSIKRNYTTKRAFIES